MKNVDATDSVLNLSHAQKSLFKVSGMDCSDEVKAVEDSLKIEGVFKVETNLMNESVLVYHNDSINESSLVSQIEKAGLKVVKDKKESFYENNSRRIYLISFSGLFLAIGLVLEFLNKKDFQLPLFGLSMITAGIVTFPKAYRSLREFRMDMNVLMVIAVTGAVFIKEYSEAASVLFLFSLAELLEAMSVSRARKAIQEVLKITPKEALLVKDGTITPTPVEKIKISDLVVVRPGDNVPVDGMIVDGSTSLNESSLTGESRSVDKKVGDAVFAGTINDSSAITIEVSKAFADSKISKIIHLIESAQNDKAPSQRFVDKFASIYTPTILVLAIFIATLPPLLGGGDWSNWIYKALVFLVIGCPCALVIATPVSVVSGLTSLAKRGILVKGGVHLESLGKLKAIALDKTGTLTEGKPKVIGLKNFGGTNEETIKIGSSLESLSKHPLATSVLEYAKAKGINPQHPKNYKLITGKGASGEIEGHAYFVGNHRLAHELGVCTEELENYLMEAEKLSHSVVVVGHMPHGGCNGEILGVFTLADSIRDRANEIVPEFHRVGVRHVVVLSGDNAATVEAVSKKVGVDEYHGGLLPEEKVEQVKKLNKQYGFVGMVGDGVNDAPALATATLGIAMGVVGSDTTIETADVALMKDDLHALPQAIAQGKRVLNVVRFNIGFALAIKAVFFVLAIFGKTNLWFAVAADMGASLIVTFNALRLLKIKK